MIWDRIKKVVLNRVTRRNNPEHIRYIPVPRRHAGIVVDHDTAMKFSAVFRAVSYISQTVAALPWDVLRESETRTRKLVNHPASTLLKKRPNPEMSAFTWRETMLAWALSWGNGYAEIERTVGGTPIALWPITPDRVTVKRDLDTGEIYYEVANYLGQSNYLAPENMFHLHGLGFDGLSGYSVISLAARSIGLGLATESYGEDFFANGAVSTGALKHPKVMSPEAKNRLRQDLNAVIQGAGKRFNIPIFEEGMDWIDMMVNPEDAQLLFTRQFQIADIARWYGLPPHKLADLSKATFSNIEHQSIEVVNDALLPWVIRFEQEADIKLISPRERNVRTKLNVRGLLRGDDKSRAEYYKIMREIGVYSTNDIRRLEDMDPVGPEGDELIVQMNNTTLKRLVEGEPETSEEPDETAGLDDLEKPEEATGPEETRDRTAAAFKMILDDVFNRILRRELNQFEQKRGKLLNYAEFEQWINNFSKKHETYILEALHRPIESLERVFEAPGLNKFVEVIVDGYMGEMRDRLRDMYERGTEDMGDEDRTDWAGKIINFCVGEL